jgi:hypothetical protein
MASDGDCAPVACGRQVGRQVGCHFSPILPDRKVPVRVVSATCLCFLEIDIPRFRPQGSSNRGNDGTDAEQRRRRGMR